MTNISLHKVSGLMSPLERVQMIISLELKGMDEVDITKDEALPTEGEIRQIATACPREQGSQYNFLIRMKEVVWRRLWVLIELNQRYLEILDGRMMLVRYLLNIAPLLHNGLEIIRSQSVGTEKESEVVLSYLDSLLILGVGEKDPDSGKIRVSISNKMIEEALVNFREKFNQTIAEVRNYSVLTYKIEEKHFGGMEIVSREAAKMTGIIPRAEAAIKEIIERHNRDLNGVEKEFNLLGMGVVEYQFEGIGKYLLEDTFQADMAWVEKKLTEFEEGERV